MKRQPLHVCSAVRGVGSRAGMALVLSMFYVKQIFPKAILRNGKLRAHWAMRVSLGPVLRHEKQWPPLRLMKKINLAWPFRHGNSQV